MPLRSRLAESLKGLPKLPDPRAVRGSLRSAGLRVTEHPDSSTFARRRSRMKAGERPARVPKPEAVDGRAEYSHSTGVYRNRPPHGGFPTFEPEEGSTIATWLHDAGYRTAPVGKYLNGYRPQDAGHVPAGWDDWKAQTLTGTGEGGNGYYNYALSDNGTLVHYGADPTDYSTDVFARYATDF